MTPFYVQIRISITLMNSKLHNHNFLTQLLCKYNYGELLLTIVN